MSSFVRTGLFAFAGTMCLASVAHSIPLDTYGTQDWRKANQSPPPPKVAPASNCAIAEYGGFANPADDAFDTYLLSGSCMINVASEGKDPVIAKVNVQITAEWAPKFKRASEIVKVVQTDKTLEFTTWATCDKDPFLVNAGAACKDQGMGGKDFSLFLRKDDAPFARNRVQSAAFYTAKIKSRADLKSVGKITGMAVDDTTAILGKDVTMTYTFEGGPGNCPVEFDWGDGDVQGGSLWVSGRAKHAYKKAGLYFVKVRALPGCSGEATSRLIVKAPYLESVADVPAKTGLESKVVVSGRNGECKMTVDYGDGKSQTVTARFAEEGSKHTLGHVYDSPGRKQVVVKGLEACSGSVNDALDVPFASIKGARWAGNVEKTQTFFVKSDGGVCPMRIEWGDGTVEEKRVTFGPTGETQLFKPYYSSKGKNVLVTFRGIDGCMGVAGAQFTGN
jgi:hypothetical protein